MPKVSWTKKKISLVGQKSRSKICSSHKAKSKNLFQKQNNYLKNKWLKNSKMLKEKYRKKMN